MSTNIFIAFAHQDRDVRDKLLRQMNLVKARQGWNIWSAQEIKAGEHWDTEIKQRLLASEVVVMLLSTDFFNSDYIVETELPEVIEKHKRGECQIIPVIARVCHWKETAFGDYAQLGDIQALPVGERPIVSRGSWDSEDEPYLETVAGIKKSISQYQKKAMLAQSVPFIENQLNHENVHWEQIRRLDVKEIYEKFIRENPNHPRVLEAAKRIRWKEKSMIFYLLFAAVSMALVFLIIKYPDSFGAKISNTASTQKVEGSKKTPIQTILPGSKQYKSGLEMVAVRSGTFMMGSPANEAGREDDECQHTVSVGAFSIGKFEVTQADWREIMGSDPPELNFKGCDQCPVEGVSWNDVQDFLKKLNAKYPGKHYRLPFEAEWEYAARDAQSSGYKKYSGSNDPGSVAWYNGNSSHTTHPVGEKSPNKLDLYDMSGNVWEWCQDSWTEYPCNHNIKSPADDSQIYALRGGGWAEFYQYSRTASRALAGNALRQSNFGFRLAADSPQ